MSGNGLFNVGPTANGAGSNLQRLQQLQQQQQQQQNTQQSTASSPSTATIPDSPQSPSPAKPVYVSSSTIDKLTDNLLSEVLYNVCFTWCIETKRANIDGLLDTFSKVCQRWQSLVTRPKFVNQLTYRLIKADVSHRYFEKPEVTKLAFSLRRAFQAETSFAQLVAIGDSHLFMLDKSLASIHVYLMNSDAEWFYRQNPKLSFARYCQSRYITGDQLTDCFKSFKWIQACSFNMSLYCGLVEKNGRYKCYRLAAGKIPIETHHYGRLRPIEYLVRQWQMPVQPNKPQSQNARQIVDDEYQFRISERTGDLLAIDHRWPRLIIYDENGREKYSVQVPTEIPGKLSDAVEVPSGSGSAQRQFVIVTLGNAAFKSCLVSLITANATPGKIQGTDSDIYQSQVVAQYDDVKTGHYCRLLDVDNDCRVALVQFPKAPNALVQLSIRRLPDLQEVASPIPLPLSPDAILSKYSDIFFDAHNGDAYFAVNDKHFGVSRLGVRPTYQI